MINIVGSKISSTFASRSTLSLSTDWLWDLTAKICDWEIFKRLLQRQHLNRFSVNRNENPTALILLRPSVSSFCRGNWAFHSLELIKTQSLKLQRIQGLQEAPGRSLNHCLPILVSNNFVEAIVNEAIEAGSTFYDVFLPLQLSQKTYFCLHNQGLWCRRGKQLNIYNQSRFEEAQHLLLQYNIISNLGCVWFEVSRSIPGTKLTWFKIPFAVFIVWRFELPSLLLWLQISLVMFGLRLSGSSCPD